MGNLYPLATMKEWPNDKKTSQLVFITRASVKEQIKHMFEQMLDSPDEAAMSYYQNMIDNIEDNQN